MLACILKINLLVFLSTTAIMVMVGNNSQRIMSPFCGNGNVYIASEECDDGNTIICGTNVNDPGKIITKLFQHVPPPPQLGVLSYIQK